MLLVVSLLEVGNPDFEVAVAHYDDLVVVHGVEADVVEVLPKLLAGYKLFSLQTIRVIRPQINHRQTRRKLLHHHQTVVLLRHQLNLLDLPLMIWIQVTQLDPLLPALGVLLLDDVHNWWKRVFLVFGRLPHCEHEFSVLDIGGIE